MLSKTVLCILLVCLCSAFEVQANPTTSQHEQEKMSWFVKPTPCNCTNNAQDMHLMCNYTNITTTVGKSWENAIDHGKAWNTATQAGFRNVSILQQEHREQILAVVQDLHHITGNATQAGFDASQDSLRNLTLMFEDHKKNSSSMQNELQILTSMMRKILDSSELLKAQKALKVEEDERHKLEVMLNQSRLDLASCKQAQPNFQPLMDKHLELNWWGLYFNCTDKYYESGKVGQQCLYESWSFNLVTKWLKFEALVAVVSLCSWCFYLVYLACVGKPPRKTCSNTAFPPKKVINWKSVVPCKPPPRGEILNRSMEDTSEDDRTLSANAKEEIMQRLCSRVFWDELNVIETLMLSVHGKVPATISRVEKLYRELLQELQFKNDISADKLRCLSTLLEMQNAFSEKLEYYFSQSLPNFEKCLELRRQFMRLPVFSNVVPRLKNSRKWWQNRCKMLLEEVQNLKTTQQAAQDKARQTSQRILSRFKNPPTSAQDASNIQGGPTATVSPQVEALNVAAGANDEEDPTATVWRQLGVQNVVAGEVQDRCVGADAAALEGSATKLERVAVIVIVAVCCVGGLIKLLCWRNIHNPPLIVHDSQEDALNNPVCMPSDEPAWKYHNPVCMPSDEPAWKYHNEEFWSDLWLSLAGIFCMPANPNIT